MLITRSIRFCLCCLCCSAAMFGSAPAVAAAAGRWQALADTVFQHLNERDLQHQIITAMVEDGDGFLWIGTQGGLARWDGYRAKVYAPKAGDPHSLPDNWVSSLHIDRLGHMWVGTAGAGLARYDRLQDRFIPVPVGLNGISHVAVNALANDGANGLWVATEGGLDRIELAEGDFSAGLTGNGAQADGNAAAKGSSGTLIAARTSAASVPILHLRHDEKDPGSLPSDTIGAVLCVDGQLWVGTSKGLVHRPLASHGNGGFEAVTLAGFGADGVFSLLRAGDGRMWIGTRNHGALVLEKGARVAQRTYQSGQARVGEWIYQIAEPRPGEIWLGTYGQGIIVVDSRSGKTSRISADPLQPDSLSDDIIWSFYMGRAGQFWIGTERGLNRFDTGQDAIVTLYGNKQRSKGLSDNTVMSVAEAPDGRVWLGMGDTGIDVLDPVRGSKAALRPDPAHPASALQQDSVFAIAFDDNGQVMLGTNRGLYRGDALAKGVARLRIPGRSELESVRVLLQQGTNWWLGGDIDGVWHLGAPLARALPPFTDLRITALEPAPGGLWIGTTHGLNWFDPRLNRASFYLPNADDAQALFSGNISSMLTDRRGRLWIGTLGGGVHLLKQRQLDGKPLFRRFGLEQGLPNLNVNKLLEDDAGAIWASTDDGLARFDPDSFAVRALQRADGVMINAYMTNSGARTKAGELLFGGPGGLTVVRPERVREWTWPANLVLTDVRVGGKVVLSNRFNRSPPGQMPEVLDIYPQANSLAVEFAALDFTAPERNRYAYRLEGYDSGWTETDASRRLAVYTNLPPGEYRLRIRGSNRAGLWNEPGLVLPVRVHPAWFQSGWWYAAQVALLLLLLLTLVHLRTRFLRARQRLLEQTVNQRTQELSENQQQLQHANLDLHQANLELGQAADILRDLGQVGREITANLDAEAVFTSLSRHVGSLLDVGALTIYRYVQEQEQLHLAWGMPLQGCEKIGIEDAASPVAQAAREQQEVLQVAAPQDELGVSLCVPLMVDQRVLGVMAIQAAQAASLSERERMIFRTLCAYGAIALANAQALQALHQAQAQLLQQEKLAALGGLVTGVAHEINTPLGVALSSMSGVAGIWQSLQNSLANGRTSRTELENAARDGLEFTRLALHNGARAAELIASFKAIAARFESDRTEQIDVNEYLHEVAELVRHDLQQAGHQLHIEVTPGLHLSTVPAALTEVLSRILGNVLDHAFAPGQAGTVWLRASRVDERQICLEVADNGGGIASDDLPHVFEPFFTTQSGQGGHVGLGLTVAYSHVSQRLQGKITVERGAQGGTRVLIYLPIRQN